MANTETLLNSLVHSFQNIVVDDTVFKTATDTLLLNKKEIYESTEDVLNLACAWHRLKTQPEGYASLSKTSLLTKTLYSNVTDIDRLNAYNIRQYYSKKIMMWRLKNEFLTRYREDLNQFIHSDGVSFAKDFIGMAFTLPKFYEYDRQLDTIFQFQFNNNLEKLKGKQIKKLAFIDRTKREKKALRAVYEYWFADEENHIVCVPINVENSLRSLWENFLDKPINLEGSFYIKHRDDYVFYQVEHFNVIFDKG